MFLHNTDVSGQPIGRANIETQATQPTQSRAGFCDSHVRLCQRELRGSAGQHSELRVSAGQHSELRGSAGQGSKARRQL
jgi:hypothetical protein